MNDIKSTAGSNPQSNPINVTMKGGAATGGSPSFNNNNITTTSDQTTTSTSSWGTWEELLLACAVKRYGIHDWDTVAMELQAKTSLPPLLTTASNCKLKYLDLRRRFRSRHQNDDVPPDADDNHHDPHNNNTNNIPWLDDLRKLRVAQLRQELHRYDVSIVSLQLKVKRLEEEREESFKDDDPKPDLEDQQQQDSNRHRSENDKTVQGEPDGSKPDHENQSVNGSNSTCSKNLDHDNKSGPEDRALSEPGLLPAASAEPSKRTGSGQSDSDSDKGSSETVAKNRKEPGRQGKGGGDSADKMRESSEAQSSVSLTKKWNGKRRRIMEVPEEQQQHNNGDVSLVKSQPLVEVLQLIRAQEHGSLFERRLPAQESDKYKSIVQQHVDLETIQTKLRKDAYSSCSLSFYRDLLLLFNNAVVFFPKSSLESRTAHQLRRLVLNEMKKKNLITRPNHDPSSEQSDSVVPAPATSQQPKRPEQLEGSDSLLAKQKSTAPIIVCRKRSSISSKPSAAASSFGQTLKGDEKKKAAAFDLKPSINATKASSDDHAAAEKRGSSVLVKSAAAAAKAKDNPVITGTRSSRRTSMSTAHHENNNGSASKKKQSASLASLKAETPKQDKKGKTEAAGSDKKRSAAADFLKRIKRNSPADTLKSGGTGTGTSSRSGGEQKRRGSGGKVDKVKERVLRQSGDKKKQAKEESSSPSKRSVGRPPKKAAAEAAIVAASPKRPRESGGQQEVSKRPKKRSRR
ncbi:hypothetical protein ACFX13_029320 [Malus domestica]|uniref:uncharacterized protein n=1 Tax=Malus domestica TaxID=3750 RepID=UPI0039765639